MFNPQKVRETIYRVCQKYPNTTSVDAIAKELSRNIFDGATTNDIEKALLLASTAFIERDPDYSKVSAGFFMQRLYKEAIGISINENTFLDEYRKTFKDGIKLGVENKYLDSKLLDFDLEKLADALDPERDDLFEYLGIQTLYERYLQKWI